MIKLEIEGCKDYLENMAFTEIRFTGERSGNLYFKAIDEDDDTEKEIEFEPMDDTKACVSLRISCNDPFVILEILNSED